jgi:ribosomal protein S6
MYEFVFLLTTDKNIPAIKALVESVEGKVVKEASMGTKALSYQIEKNSSAMFFDWTIQMTPKSMTEFKKKLSFEKLVLRYLLLKED